MLGLEAVSTAYTTISKVWSDATTVNYPRRGSPIYKEYGYAGKDIPAEYLIKITDKRPASFVHTRGNQGFKDEPDFIVIKAPLQESLEGHVESAWQPLTASYAIARPIREAVQGGFGRTTVNKFVSRRIWEGTSPYMIELKLGFSALNDPISEVLRPILELKRMALPFSGDTTVGKFLLTPPGPNAFDIPWLKDELKGIPGIAYEGETIDIEVGKFMLVKNAVLRSVTESVPTKFAAGGAPISAVVKVRFETFEILTKNTLEDDLYSGMQVNWTNMKQIGDALSSVMGF